MSAEILTPGQALRAAREAVGYLQKDLALVLGIAATFLAEIELERKAFPEYLLDDLPPAIKKPVVRALVAAHRLEIAKLRKASGG